MFFLNIIAALVLIGFIVFVFFKNNNSISLDFTNFQKKIRIKKETTYPMSFINIIMNTNTVS